MPHPTSHTRTSHSKSILLCRGAGTDANVTIALHGTKGFVGATPIENAANNFERGKKVKSEAFAFCFMQLQPVLLQMLVLPHALVVSYKI